jgi:peptidoglycan/xylan/chitin deacetylase (PgdA/CDA1 family)
VTFARRQGVTIRERGPVSRAWLFGIVLVAACAAFAVPASPSARGIAGDAGATPSPTSFAAPSRCTPTPTSPAPPIPEPGFAVHVPILTYHVIAPRAVARTYALPGLDLSPKLFDTQLRALQRDGWRTITVSMLADFLAASVLPPPKTFVITIDDGHADGALNALPILREYGFVATFYVVVGRIDHADNLTWDQVAELAASGMEIGNHTMTHSALTVLPLAAIQNEISAAQALLSAHLCEAPTTFAYPFGAFNGTVVGVVRQAGFRMAVTSEGWGPYESWGQRLLVPRITVYASLSADELLVKIRAFS